MIDWIMRVLCLFFVFMAGVLFGIALTALMCANGRGRDE